MRTVIQLCCLLAFLVLETQICTAQTPVGTAFTYQGQLKEDGVPVNNPAVAMQFRLFDAAVGGSQVGGPYSPPGGVNVADGLFSTQVDFGLAPFDGDPRWLEIAVYKPGVGYVTLTPRQPITAAPYALYALTGGGGGGCLWSQNGSDIYYNAGNVGVGTASSAYPLHVDSASAVPLYSRTTSSSGAAVEAEATSTTGTVNGVAGQTASQEGSGVFGQNTSATGDNEGVFGVCWSPTGKGVWGYNGSSANSAIGVLGRTSAGYGVRGEATSSTGTNYGVYGSSNSTNGYGVYGTAASTGTGVRGQSTNGYGVYGYSATDWSVAGVSPFGSGQAGVVGAIINQTNGYNLEPAIQVNGTGHTTGIDVNLQNGVSRLAEFTLTDGDFVQSAFLVEADTAGPVAEFKGTNTSNADHMLIARNGGTGYTIYSEHTRASHDAPAVYGKHAVTDNYGVGVMGIGGYRGVEGRVTSTGSGTYTGVYAAVSGGTGTNRAIYASASGSGTNYAGYFSGNVNVTGTLSKGGGSFKIDHPLDPANKYLYHSFVESPDMMNVYNGNIVLDSAGEAVVVLPEWFETLNRDFRYQLTCIGGFAPVYIAEEISGNQFKIGGGKSGLKVSWQVTGIRHDAFAEANRIPVEVDKPADEQGTYLHPEALGLPAELQVDRVREATEELAREAASSVEQ
jgi:hypothetical protein